MDEPVFIVGTPRSGTTLLYRILQHQKRFALGPGKVGGEGEVDLTESRVILQARALFEITRERAHLQRQFLLFDEDAVERVARARPRLAGLRRWLLVRRYDVVPPWPAAFRRACWRASGARDLLRVYFDAAREGRGVARVVEKTPTHLLYLPELRESFPRAPLLYCVRHPVDIYASARRRALRGGEVKRRSVEDFARFHRGMVHVGLEEQTVRPRSILFVRYEEVTRDPAAALERIGDFLGERFDARRLPGHNPDWKKPDDPLPGQPIRRETPDWREVLTQEQARTLERALEPELRALAYGSRLDAPAEARESSGAP